MTYKLYYADRTASMGVRVLLEEIGAPYELIPTTTIQGQPRPTEQLKINPNEITYLESPWSGGGNAGGDDYSSYGGAEG